MDSGDEDSEVQSPVSSPQDPTIDSDGDAPLPSTTRNLLEEDLAVSGSDSDSSSAGSGPVKRSPRNDSPKSVHSVASSHSSRKSRRSGSSSSGGSGSASAKKSSRSNSPKSVHSAAGSGRSSLRSRASSSDSESPHRESVKGSPARSRSGSPKSIHSDSEKSGAGSPKHSSAGSDSDSPKSNHSAKRSQTRSRSGSPKKSDLSDESDGGERIPERSPPRFDPTDSESGESKPASPRPEDHEEKENDEPEAEIKMEEDDETLPETRIDVEIPKITTDLGKSVHFVKLPNFLSVETRPFDPNTYEDEIDDEETLDEEGRARLKLKVENTIRWREKFNDKGVFVKESNARFVRWSDGTLSLHLGDEIFNVEKQALHGDHNHLFIRQGTGLQGQAVFRTKLTFRPHSTESFTHRKMTMSLADRSTKAQGIKVLSIVGADPEAHRDVLIKKEEDKLRASVRRENKQRRVRERGTKGLSSSYLDDEYSEEDNSISLAAIKNRYKKGGVRAHIYSSDEDEGSDVEQGRKLEKAKRLKDSEDEDGDKSGGDDKGSSPGSPAHGASKVNSPVSAGGLLGAVAGSSTIMDSD